MRIGRRRQYLDGTLHKRQTRFHCISIDYAVALSSQWTGLQRVDHEAVQQNMIACATSVAPAILRRSSHASSNCMPACTPGRCAMRLAQARRWGRSANRSISARRST